MFQNPFAPASRYAGLPPPLPLPPPGPDLTPVQLQFPGGGGGGNGGVAGPPGGIIPSFGRPTMGPGGHLVPAPAPTAPSRSNTTLAILLLIGTIILVLAYLYSQLRRLQHNTDRLSRRVGDALTRTDYATFELHSDHVAKMQQGMDRAARAHEQRLGQYRAELQTVAAEMGELHTAHARCSRDLQQHQVLLQRARADWQRMQQEVAAARARAAAEARTSASAPRPSASAYTPYNTSSGVPSSSSSPSPFPVSSFMPLDVVAAVPGPGSAGRPNPPSSGEPLALSAPSFGHEPSEESPLVPMVLHDELVVPPLVGAGSPGGGRAGGGGGGQMDGGAGASGMPILQPWPTLPPAHGITVGGHGGSNTGFPAAPTTLATLAHQFHAPAGPSAPRQRPFSRVTSGSGSGEMAVTPTVAPSSLQESKEDDAVQTSTTDNVPSDPPEERPEVSPLSLQEVPANSLSARSVGASDPSEPRFSFARDVLRKTRGKQRA